MWIHLPRQLLLVGLLGLALELRVDLTRNRISAQGTLEEQDVRFGPLQRQKARSIVDITENPNSLR